MCIRDSNTPAGSGFCDGIILYKNKGYVAEFKIYSLSKKMPDPTTTPPKEYDEFCVKEGTDLLTEAEKQPIDEDYIDCLKGHTEITVKYRLLIACVQKRVFVKLAKISDEDVQFSV